MSEEFKPRKRRINYKASKLFPQEMRIYRKVGKRVPPKPLDPLEMEIAELEFKLKQALGRIKSGLVPALIPRDKKLVVELRERIAVLRDKLNQKRSDVNGKEKRQ